jgi:hypothetical protein
VIGGHLGSRVSALLDGQLSAAEAERAWAHVHACHVCRDLVEREGWIKTRLAGLSTTDGSSAPDHLKGSLCGPRALGGDAALFPTTPRRHTGMALLGGGAVGVAVEGVLALGAAAPDGPVDRRAPVTDIRQSISPRPPTTTLEPSSRPAP